MAELLLELQTAAQLTAALLIEIPRRFPARVWRRNVGAGLPAASIQAALSALRAGRTDSAINYLNRRHVRFGVPGEPDIDGIIAVRGSCGGSYGVRLAVEIKAGKDRQSDDQRAFEAMLRKYGGIYVIARDVDGALADIEAAARRGR